MTLSLSRDSVFFLFLRSQTAGRLYVFSRTNHGIDENKCRDTLRGFVCVCARTGEKLGNRRKCGVKCFSFFFFLRQVKTRQESPLDGIRCLFYFQTTRPFVWHVWAPVIYFFFIIIISKKTDVEWISHFCATRAKWRSCRHHQQLSRSNRWNRHKDTRINRLEKKEGKNSPNGRASSRSCE